MVICCYIDLTTIQYNNTLSHDQCSRYKEHLLYYGTDMLMSLLIANDRTAVFDYHGTALLMLLLQDCCSIACFCETCETGTGEPGTYALP